MDALPEKLPSSGSESFTGLVCPDCDGNLILRVEDHHASFHCRVGHAYSVEELVLSKEHGLEARMWRAVFGFAEYEALLHGLARLHLLDEPWAGPCQLRAALAAQQATRLRAIAETDTQIRLDDAAADPEPR
jgi:hypothetical protein